MSYSAFFYGSLMSKVVLLRVLCGATASDRDKTLKLNTIQLRPALLKGHKRRSLIGEEYPAVINTGDKHDNVMGVICQGLELEDIKALDCFEGDDYKRVPTKVLFENSTMIDTEVYIWIGDKKLLSEEEWSFDYFIASGKEQKWLDERCEFYDVDRLHAVDTQ
ncbi:conserved hypothetical protein [Mucor ambiguus]|uniref:Putative gamma-glutamylcyclotransferase n=1 Tax=Mucor ambiguus TaxID=91626 RepID=A0A0C9M8U9_9FUNG|nr:conserved hypothetical protein [Mucor ambiguus]